MTIPKEAVQAAVDAMAGVDAYELRALATDILEAAAPYMFAQALEDAVHAFPLETIVAPDNAVVWLMRRAEELRSKR